MRKVFLCAESDCGPGRERKTLLCGNHDSHRGGRLCEDPGHIADRDGMGFETVECFNDIMDVAKPHGTFLADSVTSLVQNSLFPVDRNYEMDLNGASRCADALIQFAHTVRHAVFVSDYIYSDVEAFSESTEMYRKCLADIDRRLAAVCDTVVEVSAGQLIIHKGDLCI